MAFDANTGLETHPAGGAVNSIVNANWAALKKWITGGTSADNEYTALMRGLLKYGAGVYPADGATFRWDNTAKKLVESAGASFVMIADVSVTATTTETVLHTPSPVLTVPVNPGAGYTIKGRFSGRFSNDNAGGQPTLRVKLGAVTVASVVFACPDATPSTPPTREWSAEWEIVVRANSGSDNVQGACRVLAEDKRDLETTTSTVSFASTNALTFTVQWSNSDADNIITAKQGIVEVIQ